MTKKNHQSSGFTLVELLVVITMLAVLMAILFVMLNPFSQIDKAKDAKRKQDLNQIHNALDTYYNDNNCYPASVPFGSSWVVGSAVYMKNVPQDPDCSATGYCYVYQTDTASSCPQWNVLYARLSRPTNVMTSCLTFQVCHYVQTKYNYCVFSGELNCSYIKTNPLPSPSISSTPTPTPTSPPPPTIAPTSAGACSCATAQYDIRAGKCNLVTGPPYNYCDSSCTVPCTP